MRIADCSPPCTDPSEVRKSSSGYYYTADGWVEKTSTRSTRKKKSKRGGGKGSAAAGAGGVKNNSVGGALPNGILSAESGEFETVASQSPEDTGDEGEETAVEGGRGWKNFITESKAGTGKPLLAPMVHSVTWAMWAKTPIGAGASVGMWGSEGEAVSLGFDIAGSQAMGSPEKGGASGGGEGNGSDGAVQAAAGGGMEGVDWIEELLEDGQRSGGTTPRGLGGTSTLLHNDLKWGAFFMGVGNRGKAQGWAGGQGEQEDATVGASGGNGISAARGGGFAGNEQGGGTLRNMFADFEQSQAAHGGWFMRKRNNNNNNNEVDVGAQEGLNASIAGVLSVAPPEGPGATSGEIAAVSAADKSGT